MLNHEALTIREAVAVMREAEDVSFVSGQIGGLTLTIVPDGTGLKVRLTLAHSGAWHDETFVGEADFYAWWTKTAPLLFGDEP